MTDNADKPILLSSPRMSSEGYELDYINEAFDTNWIAPLGPNVDAFEREFTDTVGAVCSTALVSGTAALHLALKFFGVGEGSLPGDPAARDTREDVVLCSSLTFSASANPIVYQNATPVFIDSEYSTWNMDPDALEFALQKYGQRVKAVIVVHLFGLLANIDRIRSICDNYGVPIIEDAAESLGTVYDSFYYAAPGQRARNWHTTPISRHGGTAGEVGCFSFNGNKIITTSGGGMLVSNDPGRGRSVCKKIRFWATQSRENFPWYQHEELGYNYRMSNIVAGIGRGQLKVLSEHVERKQRIFNYYRDHLEGKAGVTMMPVPKAVRPNYWLSSILTPSVEYPAKIFNALRAKNIAARPIWKPMNLQPYYRHCDFITSQEGISVGEDIFKRGLCLPSDINMTEADIARVTDIILAALH